ncbi:MAG: ABC transporter ATP-binding protein [Nitrososphaerota archaeon]|nr:ABC transporter ATP-binding protein [Nitrososphaerota archaeon]
MSSDYNNERVECQDLTKIYSNSKRKALDSVSFSIPSKGIFVLIGRNGSGKTTLVRTLATELEPTSGYAFINGIDVLRNPVTLREQIAIVPQEARTVPWMTPFQTVLAYLLWRGFDYGEAKERAMESLERLGIGGQAKMLNRTLSGGNRRKVLVATVLASEAKVIFLDEPTTGLDPISRREFWTILKEARKDRFTFLTTHYMEEAEELADEIGILSQGRLIRIGTLQELRQSVEYNYSLRIVSNTALPSKNLRIGEVVQSREGLRILTNEDEAFRISSELSISGTKFTINPVSLDDIFFYLVNKELGAS